MAINLYDCLRVLQESMQTFVCCVNNEEDEISKSQLQLTRDKNEGTNPLSNAI